MEEGEARGDKQSTRVALRGSVVTFTDVGWEAKNGNCGILGPPFKVVCVWGVDVPVQSVPGFGRMVQKGYLPGNTIYNVPCRMCSARSGQNQSRLMNYVTHGQGVMASLIKKCSAQKHSACREESSGNKTEVFLCEDCMLLFPPLASSCSPKFNM